MTGLEKIIGKINESAIIEAGEIAKQAEVEVKKITDENEAKIKAKCDTVLNKAQASAEDIIKRAASNTELQYKQNKLEAKQGMITDTVKKAKQAVLELPDKEYAGFFANVAKKTDLTGEAVLRTNAKDAVRLAGIEKQFPAGLKITPNTAPADIEGGFLLQHGNIVLNCSLEAIFERYNDELTDIIQKVLFTN